MKSKKMFVVGGNGFVGSHVCREAVQSGWQVTSLSRSGKPSISDSLSSTSGAEERPLHSHSWQSKVKWLQGDVMQPKSYQAELSKADVVVHSMGILLENARYKDFVNGPLSAATSLLRDFPQHFSSTKPTPTYDQVNFQSVLALADACKTAKSVKDFVFISTTHNMPPFIPSGYLNSKRRAEMHLQSIEYFRSLVFRPGLMFSSDRGVSSLGASMASLLDKIPMLSTYFPWATVKPLSVEKVAKAIIQGILLADNHSDASIRQVVFEVPDIEALADQAH